MLQVCLCDDDKNIADQMTPVIYSILEQYAIQITYLNSGESFLFHFRENPNFMDIILMDIDMGEKNGIEVMKEMRQASCTSELIYLTAMRDYVFESFDTLPLNYILKHEQNIEKLQSVLLTAAENATRKKDRFLMIGNSKNSIRVEKNELLYIEATNRQVVFHMLNSAPVGYSGSLQQAFDITGEGDFIRVHKSYIVNLHNIKQLKTSSLVLLNGTELPLGRKFATDIRDRFSDFLARNTIEL